MSRRKQRTAYRAYVKSVKTLCMKGLGETEGRPNGSASYNLPGRLREYLREYYRILVSGRREDVSELRTMLSPGRDLRIRGMGARDTIMVLSSCRKCGSLVEMTTEEAYTPWWCCSWADRLCNDCWHASKLMHEPDRKPNRI